MGDPYSPEYNPDYSPVGPEGSLRLEVDSPAFVPTTPLGEGSPLPSRPDEGVESPLKVPFAPSTPPGPPPSPRGPPPADDDYRPFVPSSPQGPPPSPPGPPPDNIGFDPDYRPRSFPSFQDRDASVPGGWNPQSQGSGWNPPHQQPHRPEQSLGSGWQGYTSNSMNQGTYSVSAAFQPPPPPPMEMYTAPTEPLPPHPSEQLYKGWFRDMEERVFTPPRYRDIPKRRDRGTMIRAR